MKPETKRRLWIFTALASVWLCSLFIYQVIVADPRDHLRTAFSLEFYVCAVAVILAIAALILHTRKSAAGLILSLIVLGVAIICLLHTQVGMMFSYGGSYTSTEITDIGGGIGPMELYLVDDSSDTEFHVTVHTRQEDAEKIKSIGVHLSYTDLLGRYISHNEYGVPRGDKPVTDWWQTVPYCFSKKDLGVLIAVTTMDGKVYEKSVQVKTPEKPFWFR